MLCSWTKNPRVPYEGGPVGARGREGKIRPAEVTVKLWANHNGGGEPVEEKLDDKDAEDGCTATRFTYGESVVFYRIDGGGHNRPGGRQYLPERTIGKTCGDFDSTETIWGFFKERVRE